MEKALGIQSKQEIEQFGIAAEASAALRSGNQLVLTIDGENITLGPDEIEVTETPRTGWFVATEGSLTVALDLQITPELRKAGIAREMVRLVQQARKDTGLHITDRVNLWWRATGDTSDAIREHRFAIADEVLAVNVRDSTAPDGLPDHHDDELGVHFWLSKVE